MSRVGGTGTPEIEAEARKMRSQGASFRVIASRLGISRSSAHEYCAPAENRERYSTRRRRRHQAAAKSQDQLEALESALRDEITRLREKGKRNAALIHFQQADRLEDILATTSPLQDSEGGR